MEVRRENPGAGWVLRGLFRLAGSAALAGPELIHSAESARMLGFEAMPLIKIGNGLVGGETSARDI